MINALTVSLVESGARERAFHLLDEGSGQEILGPYDRFESPHLEAQNIVPQYDDGMIIVKGTIEGRAALVISIEGSFQGGGIGEVSGAKFAGALEKAVEECREGNLVYPVIIYDTGGVRLQEANYGLLSIAEISSAIVALRQYVPVVGVIPGKIGSFGGMSLTAGLCSALIMTREGRLGMNGPEVVEQEAGIRELNAKNKQLIWKMIGGANRKNAGLADRVVEDDVSNYRTAILDIWNGETGQVPQRTLQYEEFLALFKSLNLQERIEAVDAVELLSNRSSVNGKTELPDEPKESRGRTWFEKLTNGAHSISEVPSVLVADGEVEGISARFIAVVPNRANNYYRAQNGEVGLLEGWTIAKYVHQAIEEDSKSGTKRLIVPIVDVPSQAFGYHEELFGIYLSCSAAVDAYATARLNGHPIVTAIVGKAISGAFLSHGMQGNRLIALDDEEIQVHVMSKKSAALVTMRTIEELDVAAANVPSMAYDIHSFQKLGALFSLLKGVHGQVPTDSCVGKVTREIKRAYEDILESKDRSLRVRLESDTAKQYGRVASIKVREKIDEQW